MVARDCEVQLSDSGPASEQPPVKRTGIPGLDQLLKGGLPADRVYLVEGDPGTGKTTLALQFLLEGRARGESCLYIALSETEEELKEIARSHGHSIDGIHIARITGPEASGSDMYTMFQPAEIELGEMMGAVFEATARTAPARVVVDSLSELRLLARDSLRYRRQVLAIKEFFVGRACTVLLLDDKTSGDNDLQLQSISQASSNSSSRPSISDARAGACASSSCAAWRRWTGTTISASGTAASKSTLSSCRPAVARRRAMNS